MSEMRTDIYGYNIRNELISAGKLVGGDDLGAPQSRTFTTEYAYQYDDIGNRITSFDLGTNRTYTANNLNQYFDISTSDAGLQASEFEPQYDDDGNQTLIQTSTGIWTVTYNGENRPVLWERIVSDSNTQTLISMSFDRMGRRVAYLETCNSITNSHKVFTYDGYLQIANSELTAQDSQLFIWDPTEPVATRPLVFYNSDASPQYYTDDGNKNVSDLTDISQSISAHYTYTPFGALLSSSGAPALSNPLRFSSEYADDALGLVYYNYRHYNPSIGRWASRDLIEEQGGLNIYKYDQSFFDFLGLKIAWAARDLSNPIHMIGNHHFISFIYNDKCSAPELVRNKLKSIKCEKSGCEYFVLTIGLLRNKDGSISIYENASDDISAIEESYCKTTKWYLPDFDYEEHVITGIDESLLAINIIRGIQNFNNNAKIVRPYYDVTKRNCATLVNCLMMFAGISKAQREKLGEFNGVDWGEESEELYPYMAK